MLRSHLERRRAHRADSVRGGSMKQSVKRWLGQLIFGSRLNAVLLANAAVVVAFHRVEETDEGSLTVSRSTFERYCEYFARHFHVVSLGELVSKLERGQ